MKYPTIQKNKHDKTYYLHFTKDCFVHSINDWKQLFGKYSWYTFHFIHLYIENEVWTGGFEFEFAVLGLGFRFRYNYDFENSKVGKTLVEYTKSLKKKTKKQAKNKKK